MVGESATARQGDPRVSTGNPSLDGMLEGGLVARRPYLIVGPSGTGKTTLGLQFLCDGVRRGEPVLLVTLEEPPNEARVNHRGLNPEIERVHVFDAIPDIMRYERTPFKDIASVRSAVPFAQVPLRIRRSPELTSVEVTITALEQMLRTEVIRKRYTRLVIDSLTALQYFCMKGFDPVAGGQSFLRFLSDLRVTTLLTVEAPLEDVETPERMLARGEIRLFRWELEGQTVRAVGVEKFRGSSHDVRLHPYRIGPQGIDINVEVTISRDTRQIIEPLVRRPSVTARATASTPFVSSVTPLVDEVRDLVLLGADIGPARAEIEAALAATNEGQLEQARAHLSRVSSLVIGLVDTFSQGMPAGTPDDPGTTAAIQRVLARADSVRTGVPPTSLPAPSVLQVQLGALLSLLPAPLPPPPALVVTPEPIPAPLPPPAPPPPEVEVPAPPPEPTPRFAPPVEIPTPPAPAAESPVPTSAPATVPEAIPSPPPPPWERVAPPSPGPVETLAREPPAAPRVVVEPPPLRESRSLPQPPKPRSTVAAPKIVKSPPVPPARRVDKKGEPPPLPKAAMPEWLAHPADTPPGPGGSNLSGRPSSSPPPHPVIPTPRPSPSSTRKRRKSNATAAGKRGTQAARTMGGPGAPGPLREAGIAAPTPTVEAIPDLPPPISVPVEAPARSRRRTTRKRKAPHVVAVEVEPNPPGGSGNPGEIARPPDSTASSPPREG